jgi:polysaccharide pyruvyl transferase CsaB
MPAGARSILIAGYYGFGNAGDEAILAAMLGELRALRPHLELVVASGSPAATEARHGVRAVPRDDLPAVIAAVRASDLVILGGGGLFQDYWRLPDETLLTARQGGLLTYLSFPVLAALLGRPSMLYAVGVGPLASEEGRAQTRVAFELCRRATVRDAGSLALLAALGIPAPAGGPVELAADPAFLLPPAAGAEIDALLAGLGVEAGERLTGVALRPWNFGVEPLVWEAQVRQALDSHLAETPGRLLFLSFAPEDDGIGRVTAARLTQPERALVVQRPLSPGELAGLLGRCERVLAMRFHAVLFALAAGVPAVGLAYDPKVSALLADAGLAGLALPPDRWLAGEVAAALGRAGGPESRERLAGFAEERRALARRSAVAALAALDEGVPARPGARRFLDELALAKVAAVLRLEEEGGELRRLAAAAEAGLAAARGELEPLRRDWEARGRAIDSYREQREILLRETHDLDRRLTAFERTLAYRIVSRFWRLMRQAFPEGSRRHRLYRLGRRAVGRLLGAGEAAGAAWKEGTGGAAASPGAVASGNPPPDFRADLLHFEERVRAAGSPQVVAIFSGTQLLESEGQRPTQLALALAARGVPVVFVYWRWWDHEWRPQDRLEEGIVQIPIDVVTRRPEILTGAFAGRERIALFEFPHPGFFETLSAANSAGWITVYDVIDDWEEFHRVGQAIWWDEELERHLIGACDAVFCINGFLQERVRGLGGLGGDAERVGNGLKPGLGEIREPRPLARGEVTVGYFGYLAGAWFDWELIAEAARRRPAWRFYLIGYGGSPEGVELPANVERLGKQPQEDLAAFAANWDAALIPFKPDRLAAGADPIKAYEYLAMGLPVVTTGVYPPAGGEAFVTRAEGVEELLAAVERAAAEGGPEAAAAAPRRAFAAGCTWDHRIEAMLGSIAAGRQRVAEKRALFSSNTGDRP